MKTTYIPVKVALPFIVCLSFLFTSCSGFAGEPVMKVWLDQPLNGSTYSEGETIPIVSNARDANGAGIKEIQYSINGNLLTTISTDVNYPIVMTSTDWRPEPGEYVVKVTAVNVDGQTVNAIATVHVIGSPTEEKSTDLCSTLRKKSIDLVTLGWQPNGNYLLYFKFPGGVPGLKVDVPGENGPWNYQAQAGDGAVSVCHVEGYSERLFCSFTSLSDFQGFSLDLLLTLDDCELFASNLIVPIIQTEEPIVEPPPSNDNPSNVVVCNYSDTLLQCQCLNPDIYSWCPCAGGSIIYEPPMSGEPDPGPSCLIP